MIYEEAVKFVGTKFLHQGRVPGHGLDCIGTFVCAAHNANISIEDYVQYGRESDPNALITRLEKDFVRIDRSEIKLDTVLVFWMVNKMFPQHIGIYNGAGSIVHSYCSTKGGKVRVDPLAGRWERHIHSCWDLRCPR